LDLFSINVIKIHPPHIFKAFGSFSLNTFIMMLVVPVVTTILAALVQSTAAKGLAQVQGLTSMDTRHLVEGADGNTCDEVITYVTDNTELAFYAVNASNPFSSRGDVTVFSQPVYSDLTTKTVIGSAYGNCFTTEPVVSNYCTIQVFLDGYEGKEPGGWNHIGTLFDPFPSANSPAGAFDIASFSGSFANDFSKGTVTTSSVAGGANGGIQGEACVRRRSMPLPVPATPAGTGKDGIACDRVLTYVTDNAELGFYLIDPNAAFESIGDLTCFSQPVYADLDSRTELGMIYGSCTTTEPAVSNYCTVQVCIDDYDGIKGCWNHIGTLFTPFPSEEPPDGRFDIASFNGGFLDNFEYGTVTTSAVGVVGIEGSVCLVNRETPLPEIIEPVGTGWDGNPCDVVVTYVTDNSELTFFLRDPDAAFQTIGDLTHFSQSVYDNLESREVIGTVYGTCVTTKPSASNYCTLQVFVDTQGVSGGWNHIGALLNPFPSEDAPDGRFDIASFRGEMANTFSHGTVSTTAVGTEGIQGEACLRYITPKTDAAPTSAPTKSPTSGAKPFITVSAFVSAIVLGFVTFYVF
jgi:hypothetical protein